MPSMNEGDEQRIAQLERALRGLAAVAAEYVTRPDPKGHNHEYLRARIEEAAHTLGLLTEQL